MILDLKRVLLLFDAGIAWEIDISLWERQTPCVWGTRSWPSIYWFLWAENFILTLDITVSPWCCTGVYWLVSCNYSEPQLLYTRPNPTCSCANPCTMVFYLYSHIYCALFMASIHSSYWLVIDLFISLQTPVGKRFRFTWLWRSQHEALRCPVYSC